MENELYDLRKFKQETEEMCASHTVIQNMNQELENVRQDIIPCCLGHAQPKRDFSLKYMQ